MKMENKALSRLIMEHMYNMGKTLGTAESCTGGCIAEAIISMPGASGYFKGGIISYTNEIKEKLLNVSHDTLAEQTAVCEDVAMQMVAGACDALGCNFAISSTGIAGPGGGTRETPVGTIWIGYGSKNDIHTFKLEEDHGRDINIAIATNNALSLFYEFLNTYSEDEKKE